MSWRAKPLLAIGNLLWALVLGVTSSLACVAVRLFFRMLQSLITGQSGLLSHAAESLPLWRRAITPSAGALAAMVVIWATSRLLKTDKFEEYVEAVRINGGRIPFLPTLWRTVSSGFSVATGAAIGREGSMIQFAAAATSWLGRSTTFARMPLATQVACGAAAAVAAAYQAPLAGVFFAAEIVMGGIVVRTIPLLLTSALAGSLTAAWLLGKGPLFAVHIQSGIDLGADRSTLVALLVPVLLVPVLMGAMGPAYHWLIRSLRRTSTWPLPLLWSGTLVGALSLKSTLVWGNGDAALLQIMQSSPVAWTLLSVLVLRLCATTFCVGTGTVGGVFTPTIFAGSAIGYLAAHLLHLPNPIFIALLSMGAMLSAVTHAPLMAAFMVVELTGQWSLFPCVLLSSFVAWAISRKLSPHSLYAIATPEPADDIDDASSTGRSFDQREPAPHVQVIGAS